MPFGNYPTTANAISAAAKTDITNNINSFIGLLQGQVVSPVTGTSAQTPHTDFDKIQPAIRATLIAEANALLTSLTTGP
jgi:hypothetical protein